MAEITQAHGHGTGAGARVPGGARWWTMPRIGGQPGCLIGLYPVAGREQNELVRVVVTRIEGDGTMQRRVVDTARCRDGSEWEDLAARALAVPPSYRPVPGGPVYHVGLDDGTVVLAAEDDLCGLLLDLVTAVLAMGDAV